MTVRAKPISGLGIAAVALLLLACALSVLSGAFAAEGRGRTGGGGARQEKSATATKHASTGVGASAVVNSNGRGLKSKGKDLVNTILGSVTLSASLGDFLCARPGKCAAYNFLVGLIDITEVVSMSDFSCRAKSLHTASQSTRVRRKMPKSAVRGHKRSTQSTSPRTQSRSSSCRHQSGRPSWMRSLPRISCPLPRLSGQRPGTSKGTKRS
jgi:hypothetical protein